MSNNVVSDLMNIKLKIENNDLEKENTELKLKLEEAREENHKLENIVQDFDGSVRYLMTVAPQLDNILKNNLLRLKEQGE